MSAETFYTANNQNAADNLAELETQASCPAQTKQQTVAAQSPANQNDWRYLSRRTPLLKSGLVVLVMVGFALATLRDHLIDLVLHSFGVKDVYSYQPTKSDAGYSQIENKIYEAVEFFGPFIFVIGLVLLALLVWGVSWLEWRFSRYRVTAEAIELRTGMIFRQHRIAPLHKIQGVDLERKLLARLLGLATVKVTTAAVTFPLEYLGAKKAADLRLELLSLTKIHANTGLDYAAELSNTAEAQKSVTAINTAQSSGTTTLCSATQTEITAATAEGGAQQIHSETQPSKTIAPETVIKVPMQTILMPILLQAAVVAILFLFGVGVGILSLVMTASALDDISFSQVSFIFWFIPAIAPFVGMLYKALNENFNFQLTVNNENIRGSAGLTTTNTWHTQRARINAIEVQQPLIWRILGLYRVRFVTSGDTDAKAENTGGEGKTYIALPAGRRANAAQIVELLLGENLSAAQQEKLFTLRAKLRYQAAAKAAVALFFAAKNEGAEILDLPGKPLLLVRGGWLKMSTSLVVLQRAQAVKLRRMWLHFVLRLKSVEAVKRGNTKKRAVYGLEAHSAQQLFNEINAYMLADTRTQTGAAVPHDACDASQVVVQETL